MTYPQTDGSWQQQGYGQTPVYGEPQGYLQPQSHGAQPGGYYDQSAQPGQYANQQPAPYGQQYAPQAAPDQCAQATAAPQAQPAQYNGQPAPQAAYQQPYGQAPYHQAPPAQPTYGGQSTPGYYGPAGAPAPAALAAETPGTGTIVVITALFGLFGLIPTSKRAKRAEALGMPAGRYWKAFAITLAVSAAFWTIVSFAGSGSGGTTDTGSSATITADWLQKSIVEKGDFKNSTGTPAKATSATCAPLSVDENGVGNWRCMIDFGANDRQAFEVTVGADGGWVTSRGQ